MIIIMIIIVFVIVRKDNEGDQFCELTSEEDMDMYFSDSAKSIFLILFPYFPVNVKERLDDQSQFTSCSFRKDNEGDQL